MAHWLITRISVDEEKFYKLHVPAAVIKIDLKMDPLEI